MLGRLKRMLEFYPRMLPAAVVHLAQRRRQLNSGDLQQNIIAIVEQNWQGGDWAVSGKKSCRSCAARGDLCALMLGWLFSQLMAIITQGTLKKLREKMFNRMQDLPIRYFDTNNHGDIMSYYTNDIDTLRQMISQSFPQLLISGITVLVVFGIMIYYSVWLASSWCSAWRPSCSSPKRSAAIRQSISWNSRRLMGKTEGFIEEMMTGQKVVKVFCHEESHAEFDRINDELYEKSRQANHYANMLMPILNNIGNVLYVIVAFTGGVSASI